MAGVFVEPLITDQHPSAEGPECAKFMTKRDLPAEHSARIDDG